jgi:hypothetical protein
MCPYGSNSRSLDSGWGGILSVLCELRGRSPGIKLTVTGLFTGGILLASLPWLVYFGIHHAIAVWLEVYFWINLRYYPNHFPFWTRPFISMGLCYV